MIVPAVAAVLIFALLRLRASAVLAAPGARAGSDAQSLRVWAQARGASVDPEQAVRIASITKTFVAAATLRLVDESHLSLGDLIGPLPPGRLRAPTRH